MAVSQAKEQVAVVSQAEEQAEELVEELVEELAEERAKELAEERAVVQVATEVEAKAKAVVEVEAQAAVEEAEARIDCFAKSGHQGQQDPCRSMLSHPEAEHQGRALRCHQTCSPAGTLCDQLQCNPCVCTHANRPTTAGRMAPWLGECIGQV